VDRINPAEDDPAIGCCLPTHSLQLGEDGHIIQFYYQPYALI